MTLESDHKYPLLELSAGIHEVHFSLDRNPLHPGRYSIDIVIHLITQPLDAVIGSLIWEVGLDSADFASERGFGGCRLPVDVVTYKKLS